MATDSISTFHKYPSSLALVIVSLRLLPFGDLNGTASRFFRINRQIQNFKTSRHPDKAPRSADVPPNCMGYTYPLRWVLRLNSY
jgi:hypothetical protein